MALERNTLLADGLADGMSICGDGVEDLSEADIARVLKLLTTTKQHESYRSKDPTEHPAYFGKMSTRPEQHKLPPFFAAKRERRPRYRTKPIVPRPKPPAPKIKLMNHLGQTIEI